MYLNLVNPSKRFRDEGDAETSDAKKPRVGDAGTTAATRSKCMECLKAANFV